MSADEVHRDNIQDLLKLKILKINKLWISSDFRLVLIRRLVYGLYIDLYLMGGLVLIRHLVYGLYIDLCLTGGLIFMIRHLVYGL